MFHVGLAEIKGWWAIIGDILNESGLTEFGNHIADMLNAVNKSVTIQDPTAPSYKTAKPVDRRLRGALDRGKPSALEGAKLACQELPAGGRRGSAQGADRRRRSGLPGEAEGGAGAEG